MTATSDERRLCGQAAVLQRWAHTADPSAATEPGRRAFLARFEREVDPEGELPPAERARRAEQARRAHFADLGRRSAKARRVARETQLRAAEQAQTAADQVAALETTAAVADLEAHIERVVDGAPALTPEQRDRLATLLRPSSAPADAVADRAVGAA